MKVDSPYSSPFLTLPQGLGKTLQTISFLSYLRHYRDIHGPHLIVVPKSTLQNWAREFERWTPDVNTVLLTGSKEERAEIISTRLLPQDFDVLITSYEMCLIEKSALKKFSFEYIVIDEAHRIKNVDSILSQIVRSFMSRGRLLITGTPLQNNMKELFALLNFICPEIFSDYSDLVSRKDRREPPPAELRYICELIRRACKYHQHVTLAVDALDECKERESREDLFDSFLSLTANNGPSIFATSRKEQDILDAFISLPTISLNNVRDHVGLDIKAYINKELQKHSRLVRLSGHSADLHACDIQGSTPLDYE